MHLLILAAAVLQPSAGVADSRSSKRLNDAAATFSAYITRQGFKGRSASRLAASSPCEARFRMGNAAATSLAASELVIDWSQAKTLPFVDSSLMVVLWPLAPSAEVATTKLQNKAEFLSFADAVTTLVEGCASPPAADDRRLSGPGLLEMPDGSLSPIAAVTPTVVTDVMVDDEIGEDEYTASVVLRGRKGQNFAIRWYTTKPLIMEWDDAVISSYGLKGSKKLEQSGLVNIQLKVSGQHRIFVSQPFTQKSAAGKRDKFSHFTLSIRRDPMTR